MRKLLLALGCVLILSGLATAVEVTLLKFDKDTKEVTVKEGDAQIVYKITDATKFVAADAAGNTRAMTYDDAVKGLGSPKAEGALTFHVTAKDRELVEAKFRAKKLK